MARAGKLGFWKIIDLMNDDGVYLHVIFFNIKFDLNLYYNLYHSYATLGHPVVDGFDGSYEVTDAVGHIRGGMIYHSNE